MEPLRVVVTEPGEFSLLLDTGANVVDSVIEDLGHEPNGYFWEGVARWVVRTEAVELDGLCEYDSEAGMFCAYGQDRSALKRLGDIMAAAATDPDRIRALISAAQAAGFEFGD